MIVTPEEWQNAIESESAKLPPPVKAETFHEKLESTYSCPVVIFGTDKKKYIVKGMLPANPERVRPLASDQVIARLGCAMGAPVGEVAIISVSSDFISANPLMSHISPGPAHGCLWVEGCNPAREGVKFQDEAVNRERFARLAILYGWMQSDDHQLFYDNLPPHRVHSFDHGLFFPGRGAWSASNLDPPGIPRPDPYFDPCRLTDEELCNARVQLSAITTETIARAIAAIPPTWGVSPADKLGLAAYLDARCAAFRP